MSSKSSTSARRTATPHVFLRALQPTSSAVTYTVSTRQLPKTALGFLRLYVDVLVRLLIGLGMVVFTWTQWRVENGTSTAVLSCILGNGLEGALVRAAGRMQWRYTVPIGIPVLWLLLRRGYTEESLTVLRGLGLQTTTTSSLYLRTPTTRFIPTTSVQDIFIHEAFKGFEVRFYLAVVCEGEEDVVVVFPRLLPGRAILEEVWRGARACLHEGQDS